MVRSKATTEAHNDLIRRIAVYVNVLDMVILEPFAVNDKTSLTIDDS